jgi:hypothetical protein
MAIPTCSMRSSRISASSSNRVISVAAAGRFKPHAATYRKAAEIVAARPEEILFVANHCFRLRGRQGIPACAPRSSTVANGRSATGRTSPI